MKYVEVDYMLKIDRLFNCMMKNRATYMKQKNFWLFLLFISVYFQTILFTLFKKRNLS